MMAHANAAKGEVIFVLVLILPMPILCIAAISFIIFFSILPVYFLKRFITQ